MTKIELHHDVMVVHLVRGWLAVPVSSIGEIPNREALYAMVERAKQAWRAFKRGERATTTEALLACGTRSREEWMRALDATDGDFRNAPLRDEDLWRVLEDPGARPTARAAAAGLLVRNGADAARFRIAAGACAEPKVRVVLERVASGEAVPLEAAITDVTDDQWTAGSSSLSSSGSGTRRL